MIENPSRANDAYRGFDRVLKFGESPISVCLWVCLLAVSASTTLGAQAPQNWLTYSGNYNGQRYSTLSRINTDNVRNLELQWMFQARSLEKFAATPIVVDGVMYT